MIQYFNFQIYNFKNSTTQAVEILILQMSVCKRVEMWHVLYVKCFKWFIIKTTQIITNDSIVSHVSAHLN